MENAAKIKLISSMVIFGTIGLFVRLINLPSAVIAMLRGYIGFVFLVFVLILRHNRPDKEALRKNRFHLILSGMFIGVNWILLFEAYRYTTVAIATLCYYMQPVFVTVGSAILLKEKLTRKRVFCILAALLGMSFVSGAGSGNGAENTGFYGILLGIGAAMFYAGVILTNKKMHPIEPMQQTMVQLLASAITVTPYVLLTTGPDEVTISAKTVLLILFVGIFHTGFAYVLYFGQMQKLPAQTVAILSYIDPVVAILLSALLLREPIGVQGVIGAVLVLGAAFLNELPFGEKKSKCVPEKRKL